MATKPGHDNAGVYEDVGKQSNEAFVREIAKHCQLRPQKRTRDNGYKRLILGDKIRKIASV